MSAWLPTNGLDYSAGADCQNENEWCHYREPHEHGGFACDETCPCRARFATPAIKEPTDV